MKTIDAIRYFGSQSEVARKCGITKQAVAQWGEIVPVGRAFQIEVLTDGELKADAGQNNSTREGDGMPEDTQIDCRQKAA